MFIFGLIVGAYLGILSSVFDRRDRNYEEAMRRGGFDLGVAAGVRATELKPLADAEEQRAYAYELLTRVETIGKASK